MQAREASNVAFKKKIIEKKDEKQEEKEEAHVNVNVVDIKQAGLQFRLAKLVFFKQDSTDAHTHISECICKLSWQVIAIHLM